MKILFPVLFVVVMTLSACDSKRKSTSDESPAGVRTPVTGYGEAIGKAKALSHGLEDRDRQVGEQADSITDE